MSYNRQRRAEIASQTAEILERKEYVIPSPLANHTDHQHKGDGDEDDGTHRTTVSIASDLDAACAGTTVLDKWTTRAWMKQGTKSKRKGQQCSISPNISVVNMAAFVAARDMISKQQDQQQQQPDVCCLNFASAKNPGGGFLRGSQAQEESLARASGLYACLLQAPTYYEKNRKAAKSNLAIYEDLIIYSPDVPVFRDEYDELLHDPWKTAIITAPAPNRGVFMQNHGKNCTEEQKSRLEKQVEDAFRGRIDMVLSAAMKYGHKNLVLGAWGCGVFKNDPKVVAQFFKGALAKDCFAGAFNTVVFAVLDRTKDRQTYNAFNEVLSNAT